MIDPAFEEVYERLMCQRGITTTGCWEFSGFCAPNGYGQIYFNGRSWPAHRLMHTICNGPIPDGLFVLHSCDNPPCINPDHLRAGTSQENTMDSVLRGRHGMSMGKTFDTRGSAVPWECVNGHEMKGENVYITPHGRRECRACRRAARAKFVAKRHCSQASGEVCKHGNGEDCPECAKIRSDRKHHPRCHTVQYGSSESHCDCRSSVPDAASD